MSYISDRGSDEILLSVYVQPKSSNNRISGIHDGMLKIAITAPPFDGKANNQITAFLAKLFKVPKSAIVILSGHQGRKKRIAVSGIGKTAAETIVSENL